MLSPGSRDALSRWTSLAACEHQPVLAGLGLCALVAVSFFPALSGGFVWDDLIIVQEPAVRAWSGLGTIWFSPADMKMEEHYWPIPYTAFWLQHKLWGMDPFGYHLVSVLLYMANVLLLWRLLRCLAVPGAWAIAAVFAVHPMHAESAALAIGSKDLLCGLFYLAATLCWIRSTDGMGNGRDPSASIRAPSQGLYLAALGLFAAAMLSKSAAVTLPVAFAILLWWKNGRVTLADAWRIAPFLVVALCISMADMYYYQSGRDFGIDHGPVERVLFAARALWFYAGKLVWPAELAVVYPLWDIDVGDLLAWGWLVAAVAVAALLWYGRHRLGRGPLAGAAFFAVTLAPVLGFVDFGHLTISPVGERYAYLPGIGVIAVLAGAAAHGASRLPTRGKIGASAVLVAVLAVFGSLAWEQTAVYRDKVTFYEHVVSLNPGAPVHGNLANALIDAGRPAEALAAGRIAVERRPESAVLRVTLGAALLALGHTGQAEESFRRALELDPGHKYAPYNLAEMLKGQERFGESLEWYRAALDIDPEFALAHAGMGEALFRSGQYGQATESLAQAVSLQPESADTADRHVAMGRAYQQLGRTDEAAEQYERALDIDSGNARALDSLAVLHFQLRRYEEALRLYDTLIEIGEANALIYANRGAALYSLGRLDEALGSLDRALSMDPALARTGFGEVRDKLLQRTQ